MPAWVNASGPKKVTELRYKHAGEWRDVLKAFVVVKAADGTKSLKRWWPDYGDLVGSVTTVPYTAFIRDPLVVTVNPVSKTALVFNRRYMLHLDTVTGAVLHEEDWDDFSFWGGDQVQNLRTPLITDAWAAPDGSGYWLCDQHGLRWYATEAIGVGSIVFGRIKTYPVMTVGAIPLGYNTDTAVDDIPPFGYLNANGNAAYFGKCSAVVVESDGNVAYVLDWANKAIRKVELTAPYAVSTLVGIGPSGLIGTGWTASTSTVNSEGIGTAARLNLFDGARMAIHPSDEYLVFVSRLAASNTTYIRKVWLRDVGDKVTGQTEVFIPNGSLPSTYPQNAKTTGVGNPSGMMFDPSGDLLYLAFGSRIVKVNVDSTLFTTEPLAGRPNLTGIDDATGSDASLDTNDLWVQPNNGWLWFIQGRTSVARGLRVIK